MTSPITNNIRTSTFFCFPIRKKKKVIIKETAIKPTETAMQAIKATSAPIPVPGDSERPPSIKITLIPGFGEIELDRISSVNSAASSLQRTGPISTIRTEEANDLRDGFYWKQNPDGTWSILPK